MVQSQMLSRKAFTAILAGEVISNIDILAAKSNGATRARAYIAFESENRGHLKMLAHASYKKVMKF